ncbi:unnamed protein product, partial [Brassica napus]
MLDDGRADQDRISFTKLKRDTSSVPRIKARRCFKCSYYLGLGGMSRRNFTSITGNPLHETIFHLLSSSGVKKTLDSMDTCANMFILSMSGYMCYTYLGPVILTQMVELPSQERWLQENRWKLFFR